jgi:hypothetical protein
MDASFRLQRAGGTRCLPALRSSPRLAQRCRLLQARDELSRLAQPRKVEEAGGGWGFSGRRVTGIVGPTHGDGRMGTIGEPNDPIRISATPDPDDRDLLAIEWMVRMGNGDGFRKCLR